MNDNKKQIEHVIGIDLGHGETSAAICSLQWDTDVEQLEPVKDLKLAGNSAVIPSAITFSDDGSAFVGESAFNTDILKQSKVHVCFKQKPEKIDGEAETLMIRFMKEVYNRILTNYAGILTEGNHQVYIATPSGWDKQTKQLYVRMAQAAGLPTPDDGVTSESRAAFVKAQHDATLPIGRAVEKGAIVFDMGSSTLDFTYMNMELEHPIDNGYNCGASHVEKFILGDLEQNNESIQIFERKYPELRDYLLFLVRKFKEDVYTRPTERIKRTYNFEDFIDDPELEDERFKLAFMPGEMDQLLEKEGYVESIRKAMLDFKQKYIPNRPIYGVLLTGGASKMSFIKKLVCDCWEVSEDIVHYDIDPSLTISRGVAEVARMDMRTDGMEYGIEEQIQKLEESNDIFFSFVIKFSHAYKEALSESIKKALDQFADSSMDLCYNDLEHLLNAAPSRAAEIMKKQTPSILQMAVEMHLKEVEEKVNEIVNHYAQQGMDVDVSYDVSVPQFSDVDVSDLTKTIVDDVISNEVIGRLFGTAGMMAAGGYLFGLLTGGLGWLVAGGIGVLRWMFGESEEQRNARIMAEPLDSSTRQMKRDEILKKVDEKMEGIDEKIKQFMTKNSGIKRAVKNSVSATLKEYRDNIKAARILID